MTEADRRDSAGSGSCSSPAFQCLVDGGQLADLPAPTDWTVRRRRASWRRAAAGQRPTTLVLDIGGVLIPTLFESVRGSASGPAFPAGPLAADPAYAEVEAGQRSERDYWQQISAQGWDVERLWRECSSIRSLLWDALMTIGRRMKIVAFTNDMAFWFGPNWLDRFPQLRQLDLVLEASKLGVLKPDPESYRLALAAIGESPEQCLMVDDSPANITGAEAVGMPGLHFDVTDPTGSVARLQQLLAVPVQERPLVFRVMEGQPAR